MKEKFSFIKDRKYNKLDWWIKYTQGQTKYYLFNKEAVSKYIIIQSVLRNNILIQLLLTSIFLGVFLTSIYAFTSSFILIIKNPFIEGLLNFSHEESTKYLIWLSRCVPIFSYICLIQIE